jgi:hypothetical protein
LGFARNACICGCLGPPPICPSRETHRLLSPPEQRECMCGNPKELKSSQLDRRTSPFVAVSECRQRVLKEGPAQKSSSIIGDRTDGRDTFLEESLTQQSFPMIGDGKDRRDGRDTFFDEGPAQKSLPIIAGRRDGRDTFFDEGPAQKSLPIIADRRDGRDTFFDEGPAQKSLPIIGGQERRERHLF